MATPFREIIRPPSSRANVPRLAVRVKHQSPDLEGMFFEGDPGDPAGEPVAWSPMQWAAEKSSAAADILYGAGATIVNQIIDEAKDVASTIYAGFTGIPPAEPGPLFEMSAGAAASIARVLPGKLARTLGVEQTGESAGWIELPDGTRISVPKYQDPQAQGEKAQTNSAMASIQKANLETALARAKIQLEREKLETTADQFDRTFALKEREAGQAAELHTLQIRAAELALERELFSPAQRALWGRPSTIEPEKAEATKVVRAIGPGVAGGIQVSTAGWAKGW
jgi:hypothetical protein